MTSDFAKVMNSSGTPQPRKNDSGILPFEKLIESIIGDGPRCLTVSNPLTELKSLLPKDVKPISARLMSENSNLARVSFVRRNCAPERFASARFASVRSASERFAPLRFARTRLAPRGGHRRGLPQLALPRS